jgi:hypothetical protein
MFSSASFSSISFATVTPSLVIGGDPTSAGMVVGSCGASEQPSDPQQQPHAQRDRYSDSQDHERDAEDDGH